MPILRNRAMCLIRPRFELIKIWTKLPTTNHPYPVNPMALDAILAGISLRPFAGVHIFIIAVLI